MMQKKVMAKQNLQKNVDFLKLSKNEMKLAKRIEKFW